MPEENTFRLMPSEGEIHFSEDSDMPTDRYTTDDEVAIGEWAFKEAIKEGDNFKFIEEIGTKLLAVYDAYVAMQQQFDIPPVYDLELARSLKKVMGMTHSAILKLQQLSKSSAFLDFVKSMNALDDGPRKKLWQDLITNGRRDNQTSASFLQEKAEGNRITPGYRNAVENFFKIPFELRNIEELKFVKVDVLQALLDHGRRENYLEQDSLLPSNPIVNRQRTIQSRDQRVLMEIWQRNTSYTTEEFDKATFETPNTFKVGEISNVLSLFAHIDPTKRKKATESREISREAVFRATMAFMVRQHYLFNEIYKLPQDQFAAINIFLARNHGFQLQSDQYDIIQKTWESGGGKYALFSNMHIRSARTPEERTAIYNSFGGTPNLSFQEAAGNPSALERAAFNNVQAQRRNNPPTHIFRGGDVFSVPNNVGQLKSNHTKAEEYMRTMEKHGYPSVAGISGTTARHFAMGEALGLLSLEKGPQKLLIACLGFMVPLGHHSVFEITSSLKSFNIPFDHSKGVIEGIGNFIGIEKFSEKIQDQPPKGEREDLCRLMEVPQRKDDFDVPKKPTAVTDHKRSIRRKVRKI